MLGSKLFIVSLFLALSALVAASTPTSGDALAVKRAALQARMHDRRTAGHAALKKRQPSTEEQASAEKILKAQYKPKRTPSAAVGMEKRTCVTIGGVQFGLGCDNNPPAPKPSATQCQGQNYDGCSPGANYGIGGFIPGIGGSAGGVSACCRSGYSCQQVGPFQQSICLNLPFNDLYRLNQAIDKRNFGTQQQFGDFLGFLRNGGTF